RIVAKSRQIRDYLDVVILLENWHSNLFPLVEARHRMLLARRKLMKGSASKTVTIWKQKMNRGEHSSKNDHFSGPGGSSRREFLGRTIRGGALLAATTVLG